MKFYCLDYQWGAAGEHWHLRGGISNATTTEFETLCTIAGDLLLILPPKAVAPEARLEPKAKFRWYLAVWHHMTHPIPEHMAYAQAGDAVGSIFAGTIKEPVHASATLCLQFSTVDVKPHEPALVRFKESRVGKIVWWFGEEPLRKLLGAALVAGAVALVRWLVSRF
jgi:hypothetical protein